MHHPDWNPPLPVGYPPLNISSTLIGCGESYDKQMEKEALSRAISQASRVLLLLLNKKRKFEEHDAKEHPTCVFMDPPPSITNGASRSLEDILLKLHDIRGGGPPSAVLPPSNSVSIATEFDMVSEQALLALLPKYSAMWFLNPLNPKALEPESVRRALLTHQLTLSCPTTQLDSMGFSLCVALMICSQMAGNLAMSTSLCRIAERHWLSNKGGYDTLLAGLALWWYKLFVLQSPAALFFIFAEEARVLCRKINCNAHIVDQKVLLVKTLFTNTSAVELQKLRTSALASCSVPMPQLMRLVDERTFFVYRTVWSLVANMNSIMISMIDLVNKHESREDLMTCIQVAEYSHKIIVYMASRNIPFDISMLFHRMFTTLRMECWNRLGHKGEALRLAKIFLDMLRVRVHPLHDISPWAAMVLAVAMEQRALNLARAVIQELRTVFVPYFPSSTIQLLNSPTAAFATSSLASPVTSPLVAISEPGPSSSVEDQRPDISAAAVRNAVGYVNSQGSGGADLRHIISVVPALDYGSSAGRSVKTRRVNPTSPSEHARVINVGEHSRMLGKRKPTPAAHTFVVPAKRAHESVPSNSAHDDVGRAPVGAELLPISADKGPVGGVFDGRSLLSGDLRSLSFTPATFLRSHITEHGKDWGKYAAGEDWTRSGDFFDVTSSGVLSGSEKSDESTDEASACFIQQLCPEVTVYEPGRKGIADEFMHEIQQFLEVYEVL